MDDSCAEKIICPQCRVETQLSVQLGKKVSSYIKIIPITLHITFYSLLLNTMRHEFREGR